MLGARVVSQLSPYPTKFIFNILQPLQVVYRDPQLQLAEN